MYFNVAIMSDSSITSIAGRLVESDRDYGVHMDKTITTWYELPTRKTGQC